MAIGSATFIAGQYTVTWNAQALGIMEGDNSNPTIEFQNHGEPINNTDAYGKSRIDGIYQGFDCFYQSVCEEYKAATIATMWPSTIAAFGVMGVIGRLWSDLAAPLVMTSIAGTPAATSPATLTASFALLAENFPIRLIFGPRLRQVPLRQTLLPYVSGGNKVWFTTT